MTETPANQPKLEIRIIPVTPLQQNTSMIWSTETKEGVFVDPGGEVDKLMTAAEQFGVKIVAVWLTHGHMDHAGAAAAVAERTGCPVIGPHEDDQWLLDEIETQGKKYGITDGKNVTPDQYLHDGDVLDLAGNKFGVVHTPGHTPGHVVIYSQEGGLAFVGDVLFRGSVGRTDFPAGTISSSSIRSQPSSGRLATRCGSCRAMAPSPRSGRSVRTTRSWPTR